MRTNGVPIPDSLPEETYLSVGLQKSEMTKSDIFTNVTPTRQEKPEDLFDPEQVKELQMEIDDYNFKVESIVSVNVQLSEELERVQREKKMFEKTVNESKSQRLSLQSEIRRLDSKIKNLKDRNFELSGKIIRKEAQIGAKAKNNEATLLNKQLNEILELIKEREEEIAELNETANTLKKKKEEATRDEDHSLDFGITLTNQELAPAPTFEDSSNSSEIINPFSDMGTPSVEFIEPQIVLTEMDSSSSDSEIVNPFADLMSGNTESDNPFLSF